MVRTRCLNGYYKDILLVVNFNHPFYKNIPLIRLLYGRIFPNMVFYGTEESDKFNITKINTHKGYFSYKVLAKAMVSQRNHDIYKGYLLINDDILLNPWSFNDLDRDKIWEGPKWPITFRNFSKADKWYWWKSRWGLSKCLLAKKEVFSKYPDLVAVNRVGSSENTEDQRLGCFRGRSDIFYIPKRFCDKFIVLSEIFYNHSVFLEIAVPTIVQMMTSGENNAHQRMWGVYLPGRVNDSSIRNTSNLWKAYNSDIHFIHPVKLNYRDSGSAVNKIKLEEVKQKINCLVNCSISFRDYITSIS